MTFLLLFEAPNEVCDGLTWSLVGQGPTGGKQGIRLQNEHVIFSLERKKRHTCMGVKMNEIVGRDQVGCELELVR